MLYDPKWEAKANPFSLESLIAWLETMPAGTGYCPGSLSNCLLAQWAKSMGRKDICEISYELGHIKMFETIAAIDGPTHHPRTFGAALERARAAL